MNGPVKNESLGKFYPSLGISHNLLMGRGVSDLVSVGHIFAFLSSHYTFLSWAQILRCQSRRLGESRIYHSPPQIGQLEGIGCMIRGGGGSGGGKIELNNYNLQELVTLNFHCNCTANSGMLPVQSLPFCSRHVVFILYYVRLYIIHWILNFWSNLIGSLLTV